jgi:hypothetical protein
MMTKYRLLNKEELASFEDEFVKYLVVNGIVADDWKLMLEKSPDDAQKIIDVFSDVVFEQIMRSAKFLRIARKTYIQAIQCNQDKMIMVAISTKDEAIDMTTIDWSAVTDYSPFEIHKADKEYQLPREEELFKLTEIGYSLDDGSLYKALILLTVN